MEKACSHEQLRLVIEHKSEGVLRSRLAKADAVRSRSIDGASLDVTRLISHLHQKPRGGLLIFRYLNHETELKETSVAMS